MSVVVTGAAGRLGRAVLDELLGRLPVQQVTATVRRERDVAALADRGLRVRVLDYDRPETLQGAFQRGDRVLLVSSNSAGERHTAQHKAVITAAAGAGVGLIAYTSVLGITYPALSARQYRAFMIDQGVAAEDAEQLVEADGAIARGELAATSRDLQRLIRRPSTTIPHSISEALALQTTRSAS